MLIIFLHFVSRYYFSESQQTHCFYRHHSSFYTIQYHTAIHTHI